ncbi:MAG: FliI/YscN family ATPase [bacterium]
MNWTVLRERLEGVDPFVVRGKVSKAVGLLIEGTGVWAPIGAKASILSVDGSKRVHGEVVGFQDKRLFFMALEGILGIGPGSLIQMEGGRNVVRVGAKLLGRVIDGLGHPLDGKGPPCGEVDYPLYQTPVNPMTRRRIFEPLDLGIRALNGLLTCGQGQRLGIFAGSGVGKSTLLGMIARNTEAEVNVIALIGERGREVNEFLEGSLGREGVAKSVVVVATSDQPPLLRKRGAFLAMAIAEYFRDRGKKVLFMMDSITRFAMAQREIGLAVGEPPATKGYPPSVFSMLPMFLERLGNTSGSGSITGICTILVEGDDLSDPIADTVRSILDGHVVLSRDLVAQGHYPSIDVLESVSRVMTSVVSPEHRAAAQRIKALMAAYRRAADLISIGAYKEGTDPEVDRAMRNRSRIDDYLRQTTEQAVSLKDSLDALCRMVQEIG